MIWISTKLHAKNQQSAPLVESDITLVAYCLTHLAAAITIELSKIARTTRNGSRLTVIQPIIWDGTVLVGIDCCTCNKSQNTHPVIDSHHYHIHPGCLDQSGSIEIPIRVGGESTALDKKHDG